MSIASEITRLQNAKASIKSAIENKGVNVPSNALLDDFATYIAQISGGGNVGLEYEEGTYTINNSSDAYGPTINFSRSHSVPPALVIMSNITNANSTYYTITNFTFIDVYRLFGGGIRQGSTKIYYAIMYSSHLNSSNIMVNSDKKYFEHNSDETNASNNSYTRYYVDTTKFVPRIGDISKSFKENNTYKWIAIWK